MLKRPTPLTAATKLVNGLYYANPGEGVSVYGERVSLLHPLAWLFFLTSGFNLAHDVSLQCILQVFTKKLVIMTHNAHRKVDRLKVTVRFGRVYSEVRDKIMKVVVRR